MISSASRTLVFSQRQLSRMVYQCSNYEFEDVIGQVDAADLLAPSLPEETRLVRLGRRAVNKARRSLNLLAGMTMTMNPVTVDRKYDLFFAVFLFPAEVLYLNKVQGWREQSRHAACFLGEVWTKDRALLAQYRSLLRQFDHIFLHIGASVSLVESVIGRPCHLIRVGVDAIRFCPYPDPPARVVDCYSFGRR
ncbi:MAG TPA: hypothetical protein VNO55_19310, partial [Polyangia bacterium]|nr:hypothetical protein [Polyangia bacterium]